MHKLGRRNFLHVVVASGGATVATACTTTDDPAATPEERADVFPQGLASGDPREDSVILWTRVEPSDASADESVSYDVATDEEFSDVVASGELAAEAANDHTVRLKVEGLASATTYYYRFSARGLSTLVGRTKTAPGENDDVSVRFAFASCQDFVGRYFHSWRVLLEEDDVDFVVFLGAYIYETNGDTSFQEEGKERAIVLPDGKALDEDETDIDTPFLGAETLADYRSLYQQYRVDPDLQEVHRLFPFICIWDDHEFANDAWQDHSTDFAELNGDEQDTSRREVATRAWFEYQPADVVYDAEASFPNDITIYRKLRFGKHFELFLTDQRYYRDDHAIAEGPVEVAVGKTGKNTSVGSRVFVLKKGFDPIESDKKPTMLGATQKEWLIDSITSSEATWKFWGTETQLAQAVLNLTELEALPASFRDEYYYTVDQWDGYRSERSEVLAALASTTNVVAIAGDIHAFYASELHPDFDNPVDPVAVEFVVAGISSSSLKQISQNVVANNSTLNMFGLEPYVDEVDSFLADANAHYRHLNSDGNGIAIVDVDGDTEVRVSFFEVEGITSTDYPGVSKRVDLRCVAGSNTVEVV